MLEHEEINRAEFDQKYEALIDDLVSEMMEAAAATARPAASDAVPAAAVRKPPPLIEQLRSDCPEPSRGTFPKT
ncbi:MAG TPA: hypothetical protein VFL55_22915 [Acetobacteraceae bacterium]|nr:hypothetical protein [Acetobacteraceae bacterium]